MMTSEFYRGTTLQERIDTVVHDRLQCGTIPGCGDEFGLAICSRQRDRKTMVLLQLRMVVGAMFSSAASCVAA